ncbi:hypothetical protein CKQ84_14330 [Shewanella sp. WE21]|uniref:hypothetical protein n=1 Tax=Shewanella sp. WE21 TaxID=2029986 RepID=UPI000CF60343|nr:hypothetical protein [Shewanella sp. WE21]AVI66966.1 hypothetical protein CKQ84_14330 [Shewanella sp. WE21]
MKLANIELSEIRITALYVVTCFTCGKELRIESREAEITVSDAVSMVSAQGWHSYETDNETCSAACPNCIKEVRENLTETTEEPTA